MRLVSITNQAGQKFAFEYFPGGQRKKKLAYKAATDPTPFMTVDYAYDEAYLLKNLEYKWGEGYNYKVAMGYNYALYNGMEKIVSNPITYNVNAPGVVSYLVNQLPPEHGEYKRPTPGPQLNGTISNTYSYDTLGRVTNSNVWAINPDLKYGTSPWVEQKLQKTYYSGLDANGNPGSKRTEIQGANPDFKDESYSYNYLNQLIAKVESGKTTRLTYDDAGNLMNEHPEYQTFPQQPDNEYTYGLDQQLLWSFTESTHQYQQKYDGNENPTIDTYNRTEKSYVYQLGGKLLKVHSEVFDNTNVYNPYSNNFNDYFYYSHDGAVAERHDDVGAMKYFTRLGGELLACDSNGQSYFYIQNIRGDVMMLVDGTGVVKSIRDYDASGQLLCQAPRERDPFGFTGGLDAGNGIWKLGARFYDSSKSAFIQQDRYMGDPSDPLSLNRYVYCNLDPVNFVDPTGFHPAAIYLAMGLGAAIGCAVTPPDSTAGELFTNALTGAMAGVGLYEAAATFTFFRNGITNSTIINSANTLVREGAEETKLVSAFRAHATRNPDIWGKIKGNPAQVQKLAEGALNEILDAPGSFQKVGKFLEKQLADGRGIRLDSNGNFITFIDEIRY